MAGFLLQTIEHKPIGFILLAGKGSIEEGDNPRDCVFMSAPEDAELVEDQLNIFLSNNRGVEFVCTFSRHGNTGEATIPINPFCRVHLQFLDNEGTWRVQHQNGDCLKGQCKILGTHVAAKHDSVND